MAGGAGGDGRRPDAWCFDLARGRWEEVTPPPAPIFRACHVQTADAAWIVGGADAEGEPVDTVWRWDLADLTWEERSPEGFPPPRRVKAGCTLDGERMLLGGGRIGDGDEQQLYGDLFALNLTTLTWEELPQLPDPIQRQAMAPMGDGTLAILGGIDAEGERLATLLLGDPDRASTLATSPAARPRSAARATPSSPRPAAPSWPGVGTPRTRRCGATTASASPTATPGRRPPPETPTPRPPSADGAALYLMGGDPFVDLDDPFLSDLWRADLTTLTWERLHP
ncbi:MAG: hypothetical protein IPN01_29550 [Deltaproteobacteria bacterium]|nr:hypothetical protein [Deltaproteobacteria bacterium]